VKSGLSSKDLVYQSLAFEKVPRTPYAIDFTVPARQKLCASKSGEEAYASLSNDLMLTPVIKVEWGVRGPDGTYRDEFGLCWDRSVDPDIGIPHPMVTPENLSAIAWPDPDAKDRFDALRSNLARFPDKFHMMSVDFSLYERSWGMRGLENMYLDMVEDPDFTEKLLDRVLDFNLKVVENGLKACPEIDGVHFGDDFGDQNGVTIGAKRWRALLKPRLARQYALVKAAGKKVSIHSCGRIVDILDDLVEIGVDLFNPFQPEVIDVESTLRRYHGHLSFWGGISTQKLLPYADPHEVDRQVGRLLELGRAGGYVIAPAHAIPGDAKPENVTEMIRKITGQT
jgi:uroporphyrinogen decarboxylase